MSFTVNPCKACWDKYKNGDCDINTVNSCVTETAAAFAGVPSNNFIRGTQSGKNWEDCITKMIYAQGRTPCDFRLDMAPVWNQYHHYFPGLLAESGNPEQAKAVCLQQCSELRQNGKGCKENCLTDYAAVEYAENPVTVDKDVGTPNYVAMLLVSVVIIAIVLYTFLYEST